MKAVGYVRVSLDCPVDEFLDFDAQKEAIDHWAGRNRDHIVRMVSDEGAAASASLSGRAGLGGALHDVATGIANTLVVARLDRLAPDVITQELIAAEVRRTGGEIHCAHPNEERALVDATDARRQIARAVIAAVPEFKTALRDLSVRNRVGKQPLDDDSEHAAMAVIEQLAERGVSPREISFQLSAEGFRPKLSHVFNLGALRRLIAGFDGK
ncbi:MAG: recombinase family protein [Actinomycetota bacterium]|nr:recombinase family protein [Actinomycetota bacterium]